MENVYVRLRQLVCCFILLFIGKASIAQNVCPPNIDFEFGDFTNWQCYIGTTTSTNTGGSPPNCQPISSQTNTIAATPSAPIISPQPRHVVITPNAQNDFFGGFPMTPDGNNVARLGYTQQTGAQIERISYTLTIPNSVTTYSLTYKYAVVYQDPSHCTKAQPHFEAKVFDVTTNQYINCASFEYYATPGQNGFQLSPNTSQGTVYYKTWTPVTFLLSDYIGHTIRIEFTNADCTAGGHWAYCYVDVMNVCSSPVLGGKFCPGDASVSLTAPYGYQSYNWFGAGFGTPVGTSQTLTLTPPPTVQTPYAVEVIPFPGFGCRDTIYSQVTPYAVVPVDAGQDRMLCTGASNQGPSTLGTPALPGYTYSWSPAAGLNDPTIAQPIATPTSTTDYELTMTDLATGCSKKDMVTVGVAPYLSASFNINTPNQCFVGNSFTFTSNPSNGAGTTLSWNFGDGSALSSQTNPTYSYTTPGNYTVKLTATNSSGCIDTLSQNVIVSSSAVADAGADKALCGGSTTSVVIGTPALAGYTYSWSPATGLNNPNIAQPTASPTATTTYTLTATAPGNCTKTDAVQVIVGQAINSTFTINNATQCLTNNNYQFTITNPAGLTYDWDFGDGTTHGTAQNPSHSYTNAGTYTVTVIVSASGGCNVTSSQTVTVNVVPLADAGADKLICGGATTGVQIGTAAVAGATYSWTPATGLSSATAAQPTASPSATTNYVLTVTAPGGCTATDNMTVTVTPTITGVFTVNNATQCLTNNSFQFTINNPAGLNYDWDFGDASAHGTTQNPTHTYAAAGTFTVTVNVSGTGGCNATSTQTVTVNAVPTADAGADKLLCGGTTTGIQIGTPAVAGLTYSWSPVTGLSSATAAQPTALPGATTNYVLTVTGAGGCSTTDNVTVTVTPTITGVFTVNAAAQCLTNNNFQFTINNPAGLTYDWDFGDASAHGTTQNPSHTYAAVGSYTVTVNVSGTGGCNATSTQTVTVNTVPPADAGADKLLCGGTTTGIQIGTPAVAGLTYSWSPATGLSSATVAQPTALPGATTNYVLTVTGAGGCSTTDNVTVTVTPTITGVFTVNAAAQCLTNNNFQFTINNPAGLTYDWDFGDASAHGTTQNPTHSYATAGSYTVTVNVSGSGGCNATSTQSVTVNAMPVADAGADKLLCGGTGASTTIGTPAVAGYTYSWSPATGLSSATVAQPTASPSATTHYTLTVTGPGGCTATDAMDVTVTQALASGFTVNNASQCITGNNFLFTMSNPMPNLTYSWTFGDASATSSQQNPSHVYGTAGNFTVKVDLVSPVGCVDSYTKAVNVNAIPTGTISSPGTIICEGTPVVLSVTGTPATTYTWFNGTTLAGTTTTPSFNASQPGTYTVKLDNGCVNNGTGSVTLTLTKKPAVDYTFVVKCLGNPTVFTDASNVTGSLPVSYLWDFGNGTSSTQPSPTITYSTANTYNVKFTVTPQNCPSLATTATKPVTVKGPTPNTRYPDKGALENVPLQLQARNIGNSYSWSPGTNLNNANIMAPVFQGMQEVDYVITITDNLGCTTVDSQLVKVFKEVNIFMPKAFTPNGDGQNDRIFPYTIGIKQVKLFRIINRWGVIVYEAKTDNKGWDGTFKGAPQPMDGYVWELQAVDYFGKVHTRQGSFTLIR